mmetsp:Transcript_7424/g.17583  ORF Transcript_7424/g.17583 Transcript_7424/m.17583 type:complete len:214 (+) Transcript_7424:96-737(+)
MLSVGKRKVANIGHDAALLLKAMAHRSLAAAFGAHPPRAEGLLEVVREALSTAAVMAAVGEAGAAGLLASAFRARTALVVVAATWAAPEARSPQPSSMPSSSMCCCSGCCWMAGLPPVPLECPPPSLLHSRTEAQHWTPKLRRRVPTQQLQAPSVVARPWLLYPRHCQDRRPATLVAGRKQYLDLGKAGAVANGAPIQEDAPEARFQQGNGPA